MATRRGAEALIDTSRFFCHSCNEKDVKLFTKQECLEIAWSLFRKCQAFHAAQKNSPYGSLYLGSLGTHVFLPWKMARLQRKLEQRSPAGSTTTTTTTTQHANSDPHQLPTAETLLTDALRHAERAVTKVSSSSSARRVTLLESPWVGAKVLQIVLWHDLQDSTKAPLDEANRFATQLVQACCEHLDADECEVLYGRAGALQAIIFLRRALGNRSLGRDATESLADEIMREGLHCAASHASDGLPLLWMWHETKYLGAAHGVVGILHTLLCLEPDEQARLEERYKFHELVKETIHKLEQNCCWPSGNLDSSIKASHRADRLVHWCHGATGHILLLMKAFQVYGDEHYKQLAEKLAHDVVWQRGLLRKGVGLCHGISGSTYALLAVTKRNDNGVTQARVHAFARFAWEHLDRLERVPDEPYCLYNGLPALCTLFMGLAEEAEGEETFRFPLYDHD